MGGTYHDYNDDLYYYCPRNDCPCHDNNFYDSSGNYDNRSHNDNNINDNQYHIYNDLRSSNDYNK